MYICDLKTKKKLRRNKTVFQTAFVCLENITRHYGIKEIHTKFMKNLFKVWLYSLGSFSDDKTKPYDKQVLIIRTFWVLLHIVTCIMIIVGNGRLLGWW